MGLKLGISSKFCPTQISWTFGAEISVLKKHMKILVNRFMYKGLESNYANFEQNRFSFVQGGEQVLPGQHFILFLGMTIFETRYLNAR